MNPRNILLTIFIASNLLNIVYSSELPSQKNEIPVFKCERVGDVCTFTNVNLNSTHFLWEPTADNPMLVDTVKFTYNSSKIPIITKGLCETFPALNNLQLTSLEVEEITEDAFHACSMLTVLSLESNQIKRIEPITFLHLRNLKELFLHDNRIMELNDNDLFASMQNIENLWLDRNNLTEFSPELLRSNNKLEELRLYSNELSDLEAEQLLEFLPNLKIFYWDDNEVSCTRVVEINRMLISKGIGFNESVNAKVRFYPQNRIFGYLICNPDISWMASNYRKENSKIIQRIKKIDERMLKVDDIKMKNCPKWIKE